MVAAEQEVLPSQGQRPDGVFHKVVVDDLTQLTACQIADYPHHRPGGHPKFNAYCHCSRLRDFCRPLREHGGLIGFARNDSPGNN